VLEWPDRLDRSVVVDAVVNIIGFVPFGFGTCLCVRLWTGWSISRSVLMTILVGAFVSLMIELLQVFLPTRDSSLADLVTNILGTGLGAVMAVATRLLPHRRGEAKNKNEMEGITGRLLIRKLNLCTSVKTSISKPFVE